MRVCGSVCGSVRARVSNTLICYTICPLFVSPNTALPVQSNSSTMSSDFIPFAIAILKQNLSIQSRAVLGYLCYFLSRVARAKEQTKMGSTVSGYVHMYITEIDVRFAQWCRVVLFRLTGWGVIPCYVTTGEI